AKAVATACYTQNQSLIHTLHNKTPYELVHDKKPDLSFLRIFRALCYPTKYNKDLGKLKAKADIGLFVGYAPNRKGYRIYNKQTRQIMETIHVTFDVLTKQTDPIHSSSGPAPNLLTPGPISDHPMPPVLAAPTLAILTGPSVSISFDHDAPSGSHSPSSLAHQSSSIHHGVATKHSFKVNSFAATKHEPFVNVFTLDPNSEASSSRGTPSPTISTQKQLAIDALWCFYNSVLSKVEPKNFKSAVTKDCGKLDEYGMLLKKQGTLVQKGYRHEEEDLHKSDHVDTPMVERTKLDEDLSGIPVDQTQYRKDIQCAGSDTRPPMLDKADFVSWQQHGDHTRGIIDEGTEGPINLGPERPRVYSELSQEEKDSTEDQVTVHVEQVALVYGRAQNRVGNANPGQASSLTDDFDANDSDVADAPTHKPYTWQIYHPRSSL
ncbi:retrovirus-related pol polyprotein from transposon TNT 1-94, partial [Tanacetum coccineum]